MIIPRKHRKEMSLHITLGPMYSGKTTRLLNRILVKNANTKPMVIDYDIDDVEYDGNTYRFGEIKNHDDKTIKNVYKTKGLRTTTLSEVKNYDAI